MANPGEIHDGIPLEGKPRAWRMVYLHRALVTEELGEDLVELLPSEFQFSAMISS